MLTLHLDRLTMRALDDHQRAATALAVAADDLNRALLEADRAGLLVGLVLMDASDRPNVRRLVTQCSVPVNAAGEWRASPPPVPQGVAWRLREEINPPSSNVY